MACPMWAALPASLRRQPAHLHHHNPSADLGNPSLNRQIQPQPVPFHGALRTAGPPALRGRQV